MIETIHTTSPLAERLCKRLRREGPITFCEWMRTALYHEDYGYYRRADRQRWGRSGDYRTSPERSSLFAATFARYFAGIHDQLGRPDEWTILEVGAGDGQFAYGVLETLQASFPAVFSRTCYLVNEVGENARSVARDRVERFGDRVEFLPLDRITSSPGIVFSNELLDAFPVHRVILRDGRLREFYVTAGPGGDFQWTIDVPSTPRLAEYLEVGGIQLDEGQVTEINLGIEDWLRKVSAVLETGYLVTVDYGANADDLFSPALRPHGSLRSFQRHQIVEDILARPGEQDLTTTVDWTCVRRIGETLGLETVKFERQDKFLIAAGLLDQLELELGRTGSEAERLRFSTAAREMILPDGMAAHFQVLVQKKTQLSPRIV